MSRAAMLALQGYRSWQRIRDKGFSLAVGGAFATFGAQSVLQLPVRLAGTERIAVGSGVFIGAGSWLQTIALPGHAAPRLEIGDGTSVSGSCVLSAAAGIRLGRAVLIARNVYIADHNHAYRDVTRPVLAQGLDRVSPVEIGDGAWLGQNSVVTPGVRIGRGAVIAANSVVTRDVPDYALAAGAPARVLRTFGPQAVTI